MDRGSFGDFLYFFGATMGLLCGLVLAWSIQKRHLLVWTLGFAAILVGGLAAVHWVRAAKETVDTGVDAP